MPKASALRINFWLSTVASHPWSLRPSARKPHAPTRSYLIFLPLLYNPFPRTRAHFKLRVPLCQAGRQQTKGTESSSGSAFCGSLHRGFIHGGGSDVSESVRTWRRRWRSLGLYVIGRRRLPGRRLPSPARIGPVSLPPTRVGGRGRHRSWNRRRPLRRRGQGARRLSHISRPFQPHLPLSACRGLLRHATFFSATSPLSAGHLLRPSRVAAQMARSIHILHACSARRSRGLELVLPSLRRSGVRLADGCALVLLLLNRHKLLMVVRAHLKGQVRLQAQEQVFLPRQYPVEGCLRKRVVTS